MEVAVIDWKSIDSRFVSDELYEHISAPQWVDLSAPADPVDDEAWFCRPDCDHPKIVEDFFKQKTPSPSPKVERSSSAEASALEIRPLSERKQRDGKLKKRWEKIGVEDNENRNPNMSTPPPPLPPNYNKWKEAVKSSAEKTMIVDEHYHHLKEEGKTPKLRRTLSARTLFGGGGDILNKINEFCNELKKLTTRAKEKEENNEPISQAKESTRTPLLDKEKEKPRRNKRFDLDDEENTIPSMILTPKPLSIDVKNKRKEQNIRTNPPTPQCFSNGPQKVFKSKPLERGILRELAGHSSSNKEEKSNKIHQHGSIINAEKEAKSVDVFWFLKPCTL